MEGWLTVSAIYIGLALEAMALLIIGIGSVKSSSLVSEPWSSRVHRIVRSVASGLTMHVGLLPA
jgi:hypothetical protein